MKPLEISFLTAGAVISLIAGGGAARLALVPLNEAYAKNQAVADGFAPAGPRVTLSAPVAPPAAADPADAPPPAAYAMNEPPATSPLRGASASARAERGGWRRPDRWEGSRYADQGSPYVGAADYSRYAEAGPRYVEIGDRQDAGPSPGDGYAAESQAAYSPDGDGEPGGRYHAPPEPYYYPPPEPY